MRFPSVTERNDLPYVGRNAPGMDFAPHRRGGRRAVRALHLQPNTAPADEVAQRHGDQIRSARVAGA